MFPRTAAVLLVAGTLACVHPTVPARCARATPLRTLDGADGDDSDLEPLANAIGSAKIVALGEARHDDPIAVRAKVRLTRFLHRRLGFDVIAIESGVWDCVRLEDEVSAGSSIADAMPRRLFPNWANNVDLRGFLVENASGTAPMRVIGFDPQFSGDPRGDDYLDSVERDLSRASIAIDVDLHARIVEALGRAPKKKKFRRLDDGSRAADRSAFVELRAWLVAHRSQLASALGEERTDLLVRSVDDVLVLYAWNQAASVSPRFPEVDFEHVIALNNVRDAAMAEDLLFWNAHLPHHRIVVWAATTHVQKHAPTGIDAVQSEYDFRGFVPMGQVLSERLGEDYFALGVTEPTVAAAGPSFLDLRDPSCATRFTSRALGDVPLVQTWSRALDAIITER